MNVKISYYHVCDVHSQTTVLVHWWFITSSVNSQMTYVVSCASFVPIYSNGLHCYRAAFLLKMKPHLRQKNKPQIVSQHSGYRTWCTVADIQMQQMHSVLSYILCLQCQLYCILSVVFWVKNEAHRWHTSTCQTVNFVASRLISFLPCNSSTLFFCVYISFCSLLVIIALCSMLPLISWFMFALIFSFNSVIHFWFWVFVDFSISAIVFFL